MAARSFLGTTAVAPQQAVVLPLLRRVRVPQPVPAALLSLVGHRREADRTDQLLEAARVVLGHADVGCARGLERATQRHPLRQDARAGLRIQRPLWLLPNHSFKILFAYVAALEALCCANNSLADSSTGQMCRRARRLGESPMGGIDYGSQRLWGAVSWGYIFRPTVRRDSDLLPAGVRAAFPLRRLPALLTMSAFVSLGMDFTPNTASLSRRTSATAAERRRRTAVHTAVPVPGGADFRTPRKTTLEMAQGLQILTRRTTPAG